MSTQVASTRGIAPLTAAEPIEKRGANGEIQQRGESGMAQGFAAVPGSVDNDSSISSEPDLSDALKLLSVGLPRPTRSSDSRPDIVVPETIAQDSRRRMAFKLGVQAAHALGLDIGEYDMNDLIALGRETAIDQAMSGNVHRLLADMALLEGKVDEAAWVGNDKEKVAEQVSEFVQSEFKEEIDLYNALETLSAEPPLLSRRALADKLLRERDINPEGFLGDYDLDDLLDIHGIPASAGPRSVRPHKAGEHYFNRDKLTADSIRKMKTRWGGSPTEEHIARILRELPQSLDAEFGRRFNERQSRMSTLLADWAATRLSLHAKEAAIDLTGATVKISRAKMSFFKPLAGLDANRYSGSYDTKPLCGYLIAIQSADKVHRCFISDRTGAVHVVPPGERITRWLEREHILAFDDAAVRAELAKRPGGRLYARAIVEEVAYGSHGMIRQLLSGIFNAEIEQERENARGQNLSEGMVDALLDLIPFRAMVVALRRGDIKSAIIVGGLDVLSLLPFIGAGVRLGGAAVKSAAPWLSMGMRFGGTAARQGLSGLRLLPGRMSGLRDSIRVGLTGTAVQSLARLRPLDVQRMAAALRVTSPRLAYVLDRLAARAAWENTIPDGAWRIRAGAVARFRGGATATASASATAPASISTATTGAEDAIGVLHTIKAYDPSGRELALLPYGGSAGTYTQLDPASGRRIGALLVADNEGRLYQAMPLASLERYRIASPDKMRALEALRAGADGTVVLNDTYYARLGDGYVEVTVDRAVSTDARPIWRAVAPEGVAPDIVAHRLAYDRDKGLWCYTEVPVLSGQGFASSLMAMVRSDAVSNFGARVEPGAQQLKQFRDALAAGVRGASPRQIDALNALFNRIEQDPRGRAIVRAMCAQHELRGEIPRIVLQDASNAVYARPSLGRPVRGSTWYLDLQALESGSTDAVIREVAAVYNNMTGLLQRTTLFETVPANGEAVFHPKLEQAWRAWLKKDPDRRFRMEIRPDTFVSVPTPRESVIEFLRQRLREMRCYGGLDRATLINLLKGEPGDWEPKIDLSRSGLDSVPPLPDDIKLLHLSYNPIRDWRHLPQNLTVLRANATEMKELPANLPKGLVELDVSSNSLEGSLRTLPPGLERLWIARNGFTALPELPDSLRQLHAYHNHIRRLPATLPARLQVLDVSFNELRELPADLPCDLKSLLATGNMLRHLPDPLPSLVDLNVSMNQLRSLPSLPDTLVTLEAAGNALAALPANLPRSLEVIAIHRNLFRRLPDNLPPGLCILNAQWNQIRELPADIAALRSCLIYLDANPIPAGNIPDIDWGGAGPWIVHPMASTNSPATFVRAVRDWLGERGDDVVSRWEAIARDAERRGNLGELATFLDRLRDTASYRNKAFRAQVTDWLVELSKPERKALLDDTLAICAGATETCNDRVISTWNDLQTLRRNDDIRRGLYDDRVVEVADSARQMFRINELTNIARKKEDALKALRLTRPDMAPVDSIEVYLAYVVQLRNVLNLTMIVPEMEFYHLSEVTGGDLADARTSVLAREREAFDEFLVLDYEPWQALLKRKNAKAYADAQAAAQQALEDRFESELQKALDEIGLDPNDAATVADSRRNLGPVIMRKIRYDAMAPLTQALRAGGATP